MLDSCIASLIIVGLYGALVLFVVIGMLTYEWFTRRCVICKERCPMLGYVDNRVCGYECMIAIRVAENLRRMT